MEEGSHLCKDLVLNKTLIIRVLPIRSEEDKRVLLKEGVNLTAGNLYIIDNNQKN